MHKLFKPRTIRRIILLLALAFPMVYLMGTAFFALNGSHGNVLLAQEEEVVTSSQIVDFNQLNDYSLINTGNWVGSGASASVFSNEINITSDGVSSYNFLPICNFTFTDNHHYLISTKGFNNPVGCQFYIFESGLVLTNQEEKIIIPSQSYNSPTYCRLYVFGDYLNVPLDIHCYINIFDLTQMYGAGNEPTLEVFRSRYTADYYDYTLSTKIVEQTTEIPTYSEYLFNQVFGHDNIVTQLGYYALSEEHKGFAPLSALIRFVDGNILHWGDGNALAVFSYGYVYYAMSTLIVYEIVIIATKLLLLPLKAVDVFDRKGDYDD